VETPQQDLDTPLKQAAPQQHLESEIIVTHREDILTNSLVMQTHLDNICFSVKLSEHNAK
jgi:hypothetical protein